MASQAAIFAATIAGMKKAVKRKAYDSDSDSSIENLTNRGNKLRKKARYVHEGQLAPPTGPVVYRRKIEHAGFYRDIISRNSPLVDEDGYEVDSEDDDERAQAASAAAAEFDPYADVKIENLLAPLTAASDLPDHPTLAKPFLSKTLTELTRHAGEMVQKEKASLWRMKHLLTKLSGDHTWIPTESVETETDFGLFGDERDHQQGKQPPTVASKDDGDHLSTGTMVSENGTQIAPLPITQAEALSDMASDADKVGATDRDINMLSATEEATILEINVTSEPSAPEKADETRQADVAEQSTENPLGEGQEAPVDSGMDLDLAVKLGENAEIQIEALVANEGDFVAGEGDPEDLPIPTRMRTRAQAQAASDNAPTRTRSATPDSSMESFIHPYFLAPLKSHPDRDLGLPQHEAEETRKYLQLFIQKQEEVCRGAQKVYEGLLRADRYRHLVMKWAKAEAHVGVNRDMSDGEDWYDKEEWGLDEDLKKGQDEEEEDATTTAKKTRNTRRAN
ncbi:hypothetical protein D0Z07_3540 [Hyphodiscus hymeniophilus]|uniref:Transcriptional regulatory protein RXT2 N-terminal domain-containing protein n=1 Tax=Hyphodiscus hymeniophilus TaxID=353542 RepID=A0A9P7AXT7_9HELO|nr:hypothetical protein D0Z07_3540 [Hyphodiscus hymeniophilus]